MPIRTSSRGPRSGLADARLDDGEAGAHCALRVLLMRLGVAEIGEDAVAHVFGDEPADDRSEYR